MTAFPRVHSWNCQCLRLLLGPGCGGSASCSHWVLVEGGDGSHHPHTGLGQGCLRPLPRAWVLANRDGGICGLAFCVFCG